LKQNTAAILIADRTHVFLGGTPEAQRVKFEAADRGQEMGSWGGGSEHCKLPQRGSGRDPDCKYILDLLRA